MAGPKFEVSIKNEGGLSKDVHAVTIGDDFKATAQEHSGDGFKWGSTVTPGCGPEGAIELTSETVESESKLFGGPNARTFTFKVTDKAKKGGHCQILFNY